jgi:hypothetical protein
MDYMMDAIAYDCYINGIPIVNIIGEENIPIFVSPPALRKANFNVRRML